MTGAETESTVHILSRRLAFVEDPPRFGDHGEEQAVDDETRTIGDGDRRLAEALGEGPDDIQHGTVRRCRRHQFDEGHEGGRVEEVQADDTLRPCRGLRQDIDVEARGIARQYRCRRQMAIELGKHGPLELEVFGNRLDDQVGIAELVHALDDAQRTGGPRLCLGASLQTPGDGIDGEAQGPGGAVVYVHRQPGLEQELGNTLSHRARADDSNGRKHDPR